ncbi:MAG: oligosaccharide flippase family protein [Thalassovita sp.]|nr:oligosaccharide flippase family protein [Thalassovita sp.]
MPFTTDHDAGRGSMSDRTGGMSLGILSARAFSLVGARVAGNGLTLIYTLMLARMVSPGDFGVVMSGFAWAMLLSVGLTLNVESGAIRYLVRYREGARARLAAGFIRFNRMLIALLMVPVAVPIVVTWGNGRAAFPDPDAQVMLLAVAAAPVAALTRVHARHAAAMGQVLRGGVPLLLLRPAVICALMAGIWSIDGEADNRLLLMVLLVAFLATAIVQAVLLCETFAVMGQARPDYGEARHWLGTGLMLAPLLLLRDNLKHVVVVSAGLVLGLSQVGHVALALSVIGLLSFAVKAVDIVVSPQLSQAFQARDLARVTGLLQAGSRLKAVVLLAGTGAIVFFGRWGMGLFGDEYLAAYPALLCLLLIPVAETVLGPAQIMLSAAGHAGAVFRAAGPGAVALVAAIVMGGWLAGAVGAAFGAGIGYLFQQALLHRNCRRYAGVDTSVLNLRKPSGTTWRK